MRTAGGLCNDVNGAAATGDAKLQSLRIIGPRGKYGGENMGVINEYFLASSDAAAADIIDTGPVDGVAGPDPGSELASLEAILLGLDPESEEALALVTRDDHAVDIAHDDDYSRMVVKISADTTQLIAKTALDELRPHLQCWARIEEFAGTTDKDLYDMMAALHPLFIAAAGDPKQALYAWISL